VVPGHHPLERLREVVQQVPAVSDLDRLGRALPCAVGIHARAIAADDRHLRPAREPGRRAGRAPVGQQIKEAVLVQIDEDRAIALATAQGKLIHAHAARAPAGADGSARRTSRSRLVRRTGRPKRRHRRTAGRPPTTRPRTRSKLVRRVVRRACGATRSGRRSVKMRRTQVGTTHRKRRAAMVMWTRWVAQGRSWSTRWYREWTRTDGVPQRGQSASVCVERSVTRIPSALMVMSSTATLAIGGRSCRTKEESSCVIL